MHYLYCTIVYESQSNKNKFGLDKEVKISGYFLNEILVDKKHKIIYCDDRGQDIPINITISDFKYQWTFLILWIFIYLNFIMLIDSSYHFTSNMLVIFNKYELFRILGMTVGLLVKCAIIVRLYYAQT